MTQLFRYIILIVCMMVLSFSFSFSQDKSVVVAFGKLKVEWGNLDKTKITLYQDGNKLDNSYPSDNGKFQFNLLLNHQYLFWFEKPGYVTKKVDFNTNVPSEVTSNPEFEPFPDFDFYVTLFKIYPEVDTMFFTKPVGKIKYDAKLNDFDYDKEYNLEIQRHIDEIEEQIKQKHDKEVKETEEKSKQPDKKDNRQEMIQNKIPDSAKEKESVETLVKEAAQDLNKEVTVKTEFPKRHITETPKVDDKKMNPVEVTNVENATTKPELNTLNKMAHSNEISETGGKKITRIAITSKNNTLVYIKAEYNWGGRFFFIEDEPNQYRNISETYYNLMVSKKQNPN